MIVPKSRPLIAKGELINLIIQRHRLVELPIGCYITGIRGYYKNTMGVVDENDRGIYDDAIILTSPDAYVSFNANTDPSIFRTGVATLDYGIWRYKKGIHNKSKPKHRRYPALVQADSVQVIRDDFGLDTGWFGINIHRGAPNSTSSLGCQTIFPTQWNAFISLVYSQMDRYNQEEISYILI